MKHQPIARFPWLEQENLLARRLDGCVELSPADMATLDRFWRGQRNLVPANRDIAREGDFPGSIRLLLSGWACRYKMLPDGRRQLMGFFLPGDLCDLNSFLLDRLDHSLLALTPIRYVALSASDLETVSHSHPNLVKAFHHDGLVHAAIQREWIISLGKRSALERLAHLLCEFYTRLELVGLARDGSCELPITQTELADAIGLSPVHVNRTLRELRERDLVVVQDRRLHIPDLAGLSTVALFDPAFLHLKHRAPGMAESSRMQLS